ncbi:mediator of RNA polymerase II transcription subunit 23 [Octopus sinensis]|uniref:Mediator of RNA polymerase II transcription subunit 23 n=1 Tax=Octopus sinensis TaxID=2607531 RepID=A0A6P7SNH9_9MOLL|nr:mediator of RNA polymerase II transcription subunit 23 [Octopus sinensis]
MSQTTADMERKVSKIVTDIMTEETIDAFCSTMIHTDDLKKIKKDHFEKLKKIWCSCPQENPEARESFLRYFVLCIHKQHNSKRSQTLFDLLEMLVENNVVPSRPICEALLTSENLHYKQKDQWIQTFALIRKIIGGVDYKGCRDLLRVILEKCQTIPACENVSCGGQVDCAVEVVSAIIDRNSCLLPSYLAIFEISKLCADDKKWPHWKLGQVLAEFNQSFRLTAHMVSIAGRQHLLPVVGYSTSNHVWRLNSGNLRFALSGALPYDRDMLEPQKGLLCYVLEQPYSREMVCNMLGVTKQVKQRCEALEEQLVDLVVIAMERSEKEDADKDESEFGQLLWQHLGSQLIFFVLFQFVSFPHMVMSLYEKLKDRNLKQGRDHLMWILLQFISGSVQKNPLADFLPVLKLYDLLYSDTEVLPVPDVTKPQSTHALASTSIWIHLNKKAHTDKARLQRPIPHALKDHLEFLKHAFSQKNLLLGDYKIALLCNAYSTNSEYFSLPMAILVENIHGNNKNTTLLPGNIVAGAPTQPLPMSLLDSLTVHAKMSLIHSIVTKVIQMAKKKTNIALAPALVETYSRLLVYMEIESLGIKAFISQLLPNVFASQAWGILHTLLEMFSYRLHHIQPHYRVQLLGHLHSLASVPQTNQNQLHLCVESTALRLITGLGSNEIQPQLTKVFKEPKGPNFLSLDSEELNRALVLTLARAMHITGAESLSGNWCWEILSAIMMNTPHGWPSHTLSSFPATISEFFNQNPAVKEDKTVLQKNVDTEYKKWRSMANENDIIAHFSMQGTPPLFLCIIWKNLLDDNRISSTAYKVLERLGPRSLSSHLRTFADFLVFEFSSSPSGPQLTKYVEVLNDMVWKYNIVTIDRVVLCLALRNLEANEAQVCCLIIQLLLMRHNDFKSRVSDFVKMNTGEHWSQNNWHENHMKFHRKYPEKFYYEGIQDLNSPNQHQYLPIYFGNVCLRFLPVLDIVIHRLLEVPLANKSLENILEHLGGLYKFHDSPVIYLYNTLHYYENKLSNQHVLKRKLVQAIVGALKEIRPPNWCLTEDYQNYLLKPSDDLTWIPDQEYYIRLVGRLVNTISDVSPSPFPCCDWRFNEFPNPAAHALHVTCIEIMALPIPSQIASAALLDVILTSCTRVPREKVMSWMNAVALILTSLPEHYFSVLNDKIVEQMCSPLLSSSNSRCDPFQLFNFKASHQVYAEQYCSYLLSLVHACWHHACIGQLSQIPAFVRDKLKPIIRTEEQFIFLCHLIGPFLQRFHAERTRCLIELTVELYEILENVDKVSEHMHLMDAISDFLYHIKYMFVGDGVKNDVEKIIRNLRPPLQLRLRFISRINIEETATSNSSAPTSASSSTSQPTKIQDSFHF